MSTTNVAPIFATTPQTWAASLTTATGAAETGLTAPSNVVQLMAAAVLGSYVRRVKIEGRGALAAAGIVRLFKKNGASYFLLKEFSIPVIAAPSATQLAYDSDWINLDINLKTGDELWVTYTQTQNVVMHGEGADYT